MTGGEVRRTGPGAAAAVLVLGFAVAYRPLAGMDVHWHLGMGYAHLEHGLRIEHDPHTWLPLIRPPDMGAWGAQTLFAWLDSTFGLAGVQALLGLVAGLLYLTVFRLAHRLTREPAAAWLALAVVAAASVHRLRGRPDVFSLLLVYVLADQVERPPGRGAAVRIGLLCALWANLHPGVVIAPVLIALRSVGPEWRRRWPQAVAAAAGACLTPRGPLETIRIAWLTADTGSLVPEWRSLVRQPAADFWPEMLLAAAVVALSVFTLRRVRRHRAGETLFAWAGLGCALRSVRLLYLLGLPVLDSLVVWRERIAASARLRRVMVAAAVALIAAFPVRDRIVAAGHCRRLGLSPWTTIYPPSYPVEAARFLADRDLRGRMFHPVRWGGYLGRHLAPRYRTAHDGRITLFGRELAAELLRFADPAGRRELVERYALEILVLPPGFLPADELADPSAPDDPARRWLPVFADAVAAVYVDVHGPSWEHNRAELR